MSKTQDAVAELQAVLERRLELQSPRFVLEPAGAKVSGSIISNSFRGLPDSVRQQRIWDAIDAEYGPESAMRAGTFLAFTPDEWELNDTPDGQD